jgi:hypothetical protein
MSIPLPKAGELITVTFVKSILDKMTDLEDRIAALEKPSMRDATITITVTFVTPSTAFDPATNTIKVGGGVKVALSAVFSQPGIYDLSFVLTQQAANWTITPGFDTPTNFQIQAGEIPPGGQTAKTPNFTVEPTPGTTPVAGSLEVHIKREGAPNDQFITFKLATA